MRGEVVDGGWVMVDGHSQGDLLPARACFVAPSRAELSQFPRLLRAVPIIYTGHREKASPIFSHKPQATRHLPRRRPS